MKKEKINWQKYFADKFEINLISYNSGFTKYLNNIAASLLINQLLYWWTITDGKEFYKTDEELYNELGINRQILHRARKILIKKNWIKVEKKGIPAKNYYIINTEKIEKDIENFKLCIKSIPTVVLKYDDWSLCLNATSTYSTHRVHKDVPVLTVPVNDISFDPLKNNNSKQETESNQKDRIKPLEPVKTPVLDEENPEQIKEPSLVEKKGSKPKPKPNKLSPAIGVWKKAYSELTGESCAFTKIDGRFLKLILQNLEYDYDKWKKIVEYLKTKQKQGFSRFYPFSMSFIYRNLSRLLLELQPIKKEYDYSGWKKFFGEGGYKIWQSKENVNIVEPRLKNKS
jgi:hypothetical protein